MPSGLDAIRHAYNLESAGMADQIPNEVRGHIDSMRSAGLLPPPGQSVPDNVLEKAGQALNFAAVRQHATDLGVDPALAQAVMEQESRGHSAAVSGKGALGAMQVMPATAQELAPKFGPDPIRQGVGYLGQQIAHYGDTADPQRFGLAAYNAGPTNLANARAHAQKRGLDPNNFDHVARFLPEETRNYVPGVLGRIKVGESAAQAPPAPESLTSQLLSPSSAEAAESAPGGTAPAQPQTAPDSTLRSLAPTGAQLATSFLARKLPGGKFLAPALGIGAASLTNALLPGKGDAAGRAVEGAGKGLINEVGGQALSGIARLGSRLLPGYGAVGKAASDVLSPAAVETATESALPAATSNPATLWEKSFSALKGAGWGSKEEFVKDVAGDPALFVKKFGALDPAKAAEVFGPEGVASLGQLSTALQSAQKTAGMSLVTGKGAVGDALTLAGSIFSGHPIAGALATGIHIGEKAARASYAKALLSSPAGVQWLASAVDAANNGTLNSASSALGQSLSGLMTQGALGHFKPPPQVALPGNRPNQSASR